MRLRDTVIYVVCIVVAVGLFFVVVVKLVAMPATIDHSVAIEQTCKVVGDDVCVDVITWGRVRCH